MPESFSTLETVILKTKGLTDRQIAQLSAAGMHSRTDFQTTGDAPLAEVLTGLDAEVSHNVTRRTSFHVSLRGCAPGLDTEVCRNVMRWATGAVGSPEMPPPSTKRTIDSANVIYCNHRGRHQPKNYKTDNLCTVRGRQAEPVQSCYWCSRSGPGKFCRRGEAEFVSQAEYELAVLWKREGNAKEEFSRRLREMTSQQKENLWGGVRRIR